MKSWFLDCGSYYSAQRSRIDASEIVYGHKGGELTNCGGKSMAGKLKSSTHEAMALWLWPLYTRVGKYRVVGGVEDFGG